MANDDLDHLLARVQGALSGPQPPQSPEPPSGPPIQKILMAAAIGLAVALGTHQPWIFTLVFVVLAMRLLQTKVLPGRKLKRSSLGTGAARIGLGAEVAAGAVLEPGSVVEMGATIEERAVVRTGAVVRMGATVGEGAVIERGAVISWGADVHAGAVVGEGAVVGPGSDIHEGARVPAGAHIRAGSDFGQSSGTSENRGQKSQSAPEIRMVSPDSSRKADPRAARVDAVCNKLDEELKASPEMVQQFLGGSGQTVAALRTSCTELLKREAALRAEADPADLERLATERAALQKRIESQSDAQIRSSLEGAVQALDEQRRQRELLALSADRLAAEHTRLLYTLEGLASLFVRVRTGGAGQPHTAELEKSAAQLKDELAAIGDALEQVGSPMPRHLAEGPADAGPGPGDRPSQKVR